ncbi:MAG: hypothetical protein ACEPOW_03075 [Bacteroidales bacterium]
MKTKNLSDKLCLRKENVSSLNRNNKNCIGRTGEDCWVEMSLLGVGVTCLASLLPHCTE